MPVATRLTNIHQFGRGGFGYEVRNGACFPATGVIYDYDYDDGLDLAAGDEVAVLGRRIVANLTKRLVGSSVREGLA